MNEKLTVYGENLCCEGGANRVLTMKKSDKDVIGEDAAEVALLKPKRMMGFREWCEKVYDRSKVLVDDPPAAK